MLFPILLLSSISTSSSLCLPSTLQSSPHVHFFIFVPPHPLYNPLPISTSSYLCLPLPPSNPLPISTSYLCLPIQLTILSPFPPPHICASPSSLQSSLHFHLFIFVPPHPPSNPLPISTSYLCLPIHLTILSPFPTLHICASPSTLQSSLHFHLFIFVPPYPPSNPLVRRLIVV